MERTRRRNGRRKGIRTCAISGKCGHGLHPSCATRTDGVTTRVITCRWSPLQSRNRRRVREQRYRISRLVWAVESLRSCRMPSQPERGDGVGRTDRYMMEPFRPIGH